MTIASLRATVDGFNADKCPRLAAAIAYSTIFSIAPLFVLLIALATALLGKSAHAEDTLLALISQHAGAAAATTVKGIIAASVAKPHQGLIAQIIAWIVFAVGASGLFSSLQDALNAVWGVEQTSGGWRVIVRERLVSFGMIVVVGFLLLVTFVASGVVTVVVADFARYVPFAGNPLSLQIAESALSLVIVAAIFALIFKVLPDVDVAWRDVGFGAIVTAILFVVGEYAISLYFAYAGVASAYGVAGSLLVALLWIYYSAMILLLGAEFTKVHAREARLAVSSQVRATRELPAGSDPRGKPADADANRISDTIRST
jgi:membrane protein